ncbi:MAG: hypothetical protein GVY14_09820, partial [Spirochaetes bacterium]|nr:hypothetical protein [Spirochaetota bacterium]
MSRRIETATRRRIPVAGGHIICYEMQAGAGGARPPSGTTGSGQPPRPLPVLFIPGWGGVVEGFEEVI